MVTKIENAVIVINITEEDKVELNSNNPDIDAFVRKIIEKRNEINADKITVNCDAEGFDIDGFTTMIRETVKKCLQEIKLDEEQLQAALKKLEDDTE